MEQEQWLQLKILFLLGYNLKIVIHLGEDKNLVGGRGFLGAGYQRIFGWWGNSPNLPSRENPVPIIFASKSFRIFFYIPKVILKLYLDSKLQVTLTYYLYYKRDFSYCQTL